MAEATWTQSNLVYALENGSDDAIESLEKNELIYYVAVEVGLNPEDIDLPDHPSDHTGNVGRGMLREVAKAVGEE